MPTKKSKSETQKTQTKKPGSKKKTSARKKDTSLSVVEQAYARMGPIYNYVYGKIWFNEGRKISIDLLGLKKGDSVLEVGVGTGLTLPMYPANCEVTGIDLSESMLAEARKLIERHQLKHATVQQMNANMLRFADNSFDAVLGNLFISATSEPVQALREMKRVCKPGKNIVLMNHFKSDHRVIGALEERIKPIAKMIGFDSALEMEPLLMQVGLKAKRIEKVNLFNLWSAVLIKNEK